MNSKPAKLALRRSKGAGADDVTVSNRVNLVDPLMLYAIIIFISEVWSGLCKLTTYQLLNL